MSKLVNGAMLGLVLFVVLLSLFWYVFEVRRDVRVTVVAMEAHWGSVDEAQTEVVGEIRFHNPHRARAELVSVEHEVVVAGERVDWDIQSPDIIIPAGEDGTVQVVSRFPTSFIASWWTLHHSNEESSKLIVRGVASFHVVHERPDVDFSDGFDVTTHLLTSLEDVLRNCGQTDAAVCLDATVLGHSTASEDSVFDFELGVLNPGPDPAFVSNVSIQLELAGVPVAAGEAADEFQISPQETGAIGLKLRFAGDGLRTWWPKHVAACEGSPVDIRLEFDARIEHMAGNDTGLERPIGDANAAGNETVVSAVSWRFAASEFVTTMLCHR